MLTFAHRITLFLTALVLTACGSSTSGTNTSSAILGMTLSADGNTLYLANADKQVIQSLNLSTLAVSTYAGGVNTAGTTNGSGTAARFYEPFSLVNHGGTLFVADTYNHGIRQIDATQAVTTLAGTLGTVGATDGTGTAALFNYPKGITSNGTSVFVADTSNYLIRTVNPTTGAVSNPIGTSGQSGYVDGIGAGVKFGNPFGVAATATYVYVTDSTNNSIRSIKISDGTVATIAGSTAGTTGSTDTATGPGTQARFNTPAGIVTDGTNIYVADSNNHTIRKIVIATGVISTVAGTTGTAGSDNGTGTAAKFNTPIGLALDTANGILYVSDQNYTKVRKIVLSTGAVTTLNASF